jgi:predicted xylose isomerase-like sugar epimerase
MFVYTKAGRDYLLMSNTSRGVMKIPTDTFATAAPITERVEAEKAGVAYETIASLTGVEQMDLFDGAQALVLSRAAADGPRTLALVPLP